MFNSKKRNLLMICYYYPPIIDVGSKRSVAFSKYLAKYGWNAHVLSVRNPDKTYCTVGKDLPPPDVKVTYAYSLINVYKIFGKLNGLISRTLKWVNLSIDRNIFYELFCFPDHFFGWIPLALIKGFRIIQKQHIDAIYVSCTPYSAAIIGVVLKLINKKPLIIDFRDPFTIESPYRSNMLKCRQIMDELFEKKILKSCDCFIVTTEETRSWYENKYPFIKSKIYTIHNGFDDKNIREKSEIKKFSKFTIFYGGRLYIDTGRFSEFFEALKILKRQNRIDQETFQFIFHGVEKIIVDKMAMEYSIQDLVVTRQSVPYEENLSVIEKSHLLLLRIAKPMISTKLFEGLALNIPFLATIPSGEVEHIIRRFSPASYIVNMDCDKYSPEAIPEVAEAILDARKKYENDTIKSNLVEEFLQQFSRENLTLKLVSAIEENLGAKNNSLIIN